MAATMAGVGPVIGCGDVTIYMNRIGKLLLGRAAKTCPLKGRRSSPWRFDMRNEKIWRYLGGTLDAGPAA
jgi:hypothetical protein